MNNARWTLLVLYFAMPYRVAEIVGFQWLPFPPGVYEEFRQGFPFVSALDLLIYAFAAFSSQVQRRLFWVALLAPPCCLALARVVYSDLWVAIACSISPLILCWQLTRVEGDARRVLCVAAGILGALAVLLSLGGSTANEYDERFRINLPGLDVTSTGHVFGWMVAAAYLVWRTTPKPDSVRPLALLALGASLAGLALSGARIPQAYVLIALVGVESQRRLTADISLVPSLVLLCSVLGVYGLFIAGVIDITQFDLELDPSVLGRGAAWTSAAASIAADPWQASLSNWGVQARLEEVGYLSHSHSALLQFAQVFGAPLLTMGSVALAVHLVRRLKREWRLVTTLWLCAQLFDYNYAHAKFWFFTGLLLLLSTRIHTALTPPHDHRLDC